MSALSQSPIHLSCGASQHPWTQVRTPLNGMMASAQLLLESALTPEQRELAETILESGNSLLGILGESSARLHALAWHEGKCLRDLPACTRMPRCMASSAWPGARCELGWAPWTWLVSPPLCFPSGDILDFSKLDHGAVELEYAPVCMRRTVEACIEVGFTDDAG